MSDLISYSDARDLLLRLTAPVDTEQVPLEDAAGRILAQEVSARENVPPFDRSPYDGYAFRAADTASASPDSPVTLKILEEIPAGGVSHCPVTEGCAVKILTGAPIPAGADAVTKFEATVFTRDTVTISAPFQSGDNIVRTGEDVRVGTVLAQRGTCIDPGLAGTLASQNIPLPAVYRVPRIGILSTGSELLEVGSEAQPGKIYDSNRYTLAAAVRRLGCTPVLLGHASDVVEDIRRQIEAGLAACDALLLTGGVSVGDYDLTPAAMELAGVELLFRGVALKPGMACAYGIRGGKLVCGLSGNPASSITNFYTVAAPALRKLCGLREYMPRQFPVTLAEGFRKKSPGTRVLRGRLDLSSGSAQMHLSGSQGNVVLSSTIGCDVMAIVPAGSGPLSPGTSLTAFFL